MSERVGLDPGLAGEAATSLSSRIVAIESLIDELTSHIRLSLNPADRPMLPGDIAIAAWSLPVATVGLRHLETAAANAILLTQSLRTQIERQRAASSGDDAGYRSSFVSLAGAASLYRRALANPSALEALTPALAAAFFRALTEGEAAALAAAWPEQVGGLEGAPYRLRDAANRAALRQILDDASIPADSPRRLAAEQAAKALDDAAARDLGPVQLVALALPETGTKADMRAVISVGDLDRAEDIGVMVPGMNSNVEDSMRNLVWNAGNMQEDLTRRSINKSSSPTAVVAWLGYESPSENPIDADRFVGGDHLAEVGGKELADHLRGVESANTDSRITVLAHSYGTRVATYALSIGGHADALVMYGSPGIAESVHASADLIGVPTDRVYSTKSEGDLLRSTGNVINDAIRAGLTGEWGSLGVDVLGEEMSNADGRPNADPNDPAFGAKVFATRDSPGHSLGEEGGSVAGYWGPPGTDSLDNGAWIMLGLEPAA